VPTGGLLCRIDETAAAPADDGATEPAPALTGDRQAGLSSPSMRRQAREDGVDIGDVKGTGEHGRITHDDVQRAARKTSPSAATPAATASAPAPQAARPARSVTTSAATDIAQLMKQGPIPGVGYGAYKLPPYVPKPGDEVVPFSRRRRITADHMVYSQAVSPHVVTVAEVDLQATAQLRDEHKLAFKKQGVPLTYLAFVVAAVVKALREHPGVNARVLDDSYVVHKDVNVGIAIDTPGGLLVANIKQTDQLSLRGIASGIHEVASRARAGNVTADDLMGTTFTVSNPGRKGNLFGGAIISQPNVAILRIGEIKKRAVVVTHGGDDQIAIHPVMFVALSYDHRIIDGVEANSFLWRISEVLSTAEFEI
jgi:2-oxoglutarate dehydrogenase E2 component (dihydrolipoamide succinyltransferase)